MASWTNVTLPDRSGIKEILAQENKKLKFEIQQLTNLLDQYQRELENIPEAAIKFGFVNISDARGKFLCKLQYVGNEADKEGVKND